MAAIGAIGLALSCLTEHPLAAMAALMVIVIASEIADSVQQISAVALSADALAAVLGRAAAGASRLGRHPARTVCVRCLRGDLRLMAWARLGAAGFTS